ncbi:MAG: FGGY family carbohydrate kinase [Clostridiales bacterium]|nr:FGGY family carbohydrate kinase [Clostridiales bacterium]
MSLLGIDAGSSSVKVSAYTEDGRFLANVSNGITALHSAPGVWEQDPLDVWRAAKRGLCELAANDALRKDPPKALAISASGRENFPADEAGNPLGNNIMGADTRGAELESGLENGVEPWELSCGHRRERMDPVFRLMWWRSNHPDIVEKARTYPDWHGFLTLMLCGRNVSEPSMVGRWLVYDLMTNTWSQKRCAEYDIPERFLPEVLPGGTPVAPIMPKVAEELGLPASLMVVCGGHDLNCAALGSGVSRLGIACLVSGSLENMLIPTLKFPTAPLLEKGFSITPNFGEMERSIYAICPTGNAVLNWARDTVSLSIADAEALLSRQPSPVIALPYLSGAMLHWEDGRKLRGALLGLTLATKPEQIVQAFMESIAYDHVYTLSFLRGQGVSVERICAMGGGTRSAWWTQLKADMLGVPVEVSAEQEPGTFGAAFLAGIGAGVFASVADMAEVCPKAVKYYAPEPERRKAHEERLRHYSEIVPKLKEVVFEGFI